MECKGLVFKKHLGVDLVVQQAERPLLHCAAFKPLMPQIAISSIHAVVAKLMGLKGKT